MSHHTVAQLIGSISLERLHRDLLYLSRDPLPRRTLNFALPGHQLSTLEEADRYLASQLEVCGYRVELERVPVQAQRRDRSKALAHQYSPPMPNDPWYSAANLYATLKGSEGSDGVVLLMGHKDSQSWIPSPGANDNAVGTAAVLEMARVLSSTSPRLSVRFLFCNEEHWPWTSVAAAQRARDRGDSLVAIFNVDGIGAKPAEQAGMKTNVVAYTAPEGEPIARLVVEVNERYRIGLQQRIVRRPAPGDDDGSFVRAGYPAAVLCIGSWPYGDPNYHTEGDVPELVDLENVRMAAQATLAAALHIALQL